MNGFTGFDDFDDFFGLVDVMDIFSNRRIVEKYPQSVKESDEGITIEIEAPRIKREDISITYKKGIITVSIGKDTPHVIKGKLSEKYDITKLTSKLEYGILTLFAPLSEEEKKAEVVVEIQ